jgi:hypothetical protein
LLFELEFAEALVAAVFVALCVALAAVVAAALVALCVGVVVAPLEAAGTVDGAAEVDGAAATAPLLIDPMPAIDRESVAEKFGGVMDITAPRPPSVPPAISSPRFI